MLRQQERTRRWSIVAALAALGDVPDLLIMNGRVYTAVEGRPRLG